MGGPELRGSTVKSTTSPKHSGSTWTAPRPPWNGPPPTATSAARWRCTAAPATGTRWAPAWTCLPTDSGPPSSNTPPTWNHGTPTRQPSCSRSSPTAPSSGPAPTDHSTAGRRSTATSGESTTPQEPGLDPHEGPGRWLVTADDDVLYGLDYRVVPQEEVAGG